MGRNRNFIEADAIGQAASAFLRTGYEGTSIDDLVRATGLHRGSLYNAFGSKRNLFLRALRRAAESEVTNESMDLLLVALLELAPRDREVRTLVMEIFEKASPPVTAQTLGQRLIDRANEPTVVSKEEP